MKKIKITINDVLAQKNIDKAILYMESKKDSIDDSGLSLSGLREYWKHNSKTISQAIINGTYEFGIVHEKIIVSANGKHRKIALIPSLDRMLHKATSQVLESHFEKRFSNCSFAYQKNKGTSDAVLKAAEYIEIGKEYVAEIDIKDFFDEISHEKLFKILDNIIESSELKDMLIKMVTCRVERDWKLYNKNRGLFQGSSLSPGLSNVYLTLFDRWCEEQGFAFVRYADNINVYCDSVVEGQEVLNLVEGKLKEYDLTINQDKKGVYSTFSRRYLGYYFEKVGSSILVKKQQKKKLHVFSKWHQDSIEKIDNNYYIVNDGILTKKDFTILFENEEKKIYLPLETTDSINVYSNIEITSGFLEAIKDKNLNVNIFNKYGILTGSFFSANQKNRIKCLIEQVDIYKSKSKRLELAKHLEMAYLHNMRCNIRYYLKHNKSEQLIEVSEYIKGQKIKINESKSVDNILLIEARSRQKYYSCFNDMIKNSDFRFVNRTKRPPKDPINALISFGNTYLYQKIAQDIYKTSLDIRVSFVHSSLKRFENLNLDLADIFKPIIVDRTIFTLINKKVLSVQKHFESYGDNGIYLNKEGKKIFVEELNKKMMQVITVNDIQYTYDRLLMLEVKKLENGIMGKSRYKPFKYQL